MVVESKTWIFAPTPVCPLATGMAHHVITALMTLSVFFWVVSCVERSCPHGLLISSARGDDLSCFTFLLFTPDCFMIRVSKRSVGTVILQNWFAKKFIHAIPFISI